MNQKLKESKKELKQIRKIHSMLERKRNKIARKIIATKGLETLKIYKFKTKYDDREDEYNLPRKEVMNAVQYVNKRDQFKKMSSLMRLKEVQSQCFNKSSTFKNKKSSTAR